MKKIIFIILILLGPTSVFAHGGHHNLGEINFSTSGNERAQVFFKRGVMWLHSFEYPEARADFQMAEKLDPDFAMAYWGEAMTYNHPLWVEQDQRAALKVLTKLAPTAGARVAKAKTAKEKGFIQAINLLYGHGDKETRDRVYADAMRKLYREYPADDEIASFYALALLGATQGERDYRSYMQAAGVAEEIYGRNPCHPGAMHYVIHSYDDPIHAPLGLRAARAYAKSAPDASHALHMPSHIFLAMGMWDDVIASNKAAWEAGIKQNPAANAQAYTLDDLHALQWLSYGYLQKQQYQQAYVLTKKMEQIAEHSQSPMAKWYYALMRAAYISDSQNWQAELKSLDMTSIELSARVSDLYTNALIALNNNNIVVAKNILKQISEIALMRVPPNKAHKDYFTAVLVSGVTAAKIMCLELAAQIKLHEGKMDEAIRLLRCAVKLEGQLSFGYGPPIPVKPSYELLGQVLLQSKKYHDAYQKYVMASKRMPNRFAVEQGLKQVVVALKTEGLPVPENVKPYFNKLMLPDFYK